MIHADPTASPSLRPLAGASVPGRVLDAVGGAGHRALSVGLLAGGTGALVLSLLPMPGGLRLALLVMGVVLLLVPVLLAGGGLARQVLRRLRLRALARKAERDPDPTLLADRDGRVLAANAAARGTLTGATEVATLLRSRVADPHAVVARLQALARTGRAASDGAGGPRGWRLGVRCVGPGLDLWQFELAEHARTSDERLPCLDVSPKGEILAANAAALALLGVVPERVDDLPLDPPLAPGRVHRLRGPAGPLAYLVAEVGSEDGTRHLYLLPWEGLDPAAPWDPLEELPVPMLRLAPDGAVRSANRHARALLPVALQPGARLSDLLEGLGRPVIEWISDVAAGRPHPGPQFLRGVGPHRDTILRVALSLGGAPGEPEIVAVLDDVTELKAIEAQFVQSQKMQALGQLAGGVAHDFNNLLTAISGHCDLLLLRHDEADPDYADLIQVRQNVNRAASLVGQLLAFSRKQSLSPEVIDLRAALSDLTHLLNRLVGEKVRLALDHDPGLECIRADRRQFEQVVMNLVVNARDAMPDGGEIRIETGNRDLDRPLVRDRATLPAGRYVLVRVVDQGVGIPPERLPKIFEPFYTTKRPGEGTGLGLSTAYGIMKQSGGYIFAESEVGGGSTFTLWFPAHGRLAPSRPAPVPRAPPARRGEGVVLLAEDEAPVRAFAARALRLRGYEVIEADSGEAALAAMADPAVRVDLIVSDVILPDMDGPTWVLRAIEGRPGTRVAFISGYAEESFSEQKARIHGSVFLAKPFTLHEFTATVDRCLSEGTDPGLEAPPGP